MPGAKGKKVLSRSLQIDSVRAPLQCLARAFPTLCYHSLPICIEHKCQPKMKALGLLGSFLNMCPTLGVWVAFQIPWCVWDLSKDLTSPSYLLPHPLPSQGFWFVYGLHCPSCHPSCHVAVANTFAFKPVQQTAPLQHSESSKAGEERQALKLILQGSTRQVKTQATVLWN